MSDQPDLAIRNATIVLPWGEYRVDLGITGDRIAAIGVVPAARETIDATGLHVLPGIIDPHVHFRDAGQGPPDPSGETLESGTRGAVLGGVTTIFDMPNTRPALTDVATLAIKRAHAEQVAWCDVGLYVGATKTNAAELAALERGRGVCAVKVFAGSSTGDLLVDDDASIDAVLAHGYRRVAFHSEDEARLRARRALFETGTYADHPRWRDEECAFLGTRRIVALAEHRRRPIHILHVSTQEELDWLDGHRALVTVEVLVNHLVQSAPDAYERLGGYAVMNPPIRDARHRTAAWRAIADGRVDTIGSDHAPHPRDAKERPWPHTAAGLTGTQTLLPLMLDAVAAGHLTLSRLADLMSAGPARVYGLRGKGRIARGSQADLTLVDLAARRTIEADWLASPCGWSPFEGQTVTGWPVATIVRGQIVMRDGALLGTPIGRLAAFD